MRGHRRACLSLCTRTHAVSSWLQAVSTLRLLSLLKHLLWPPVLLVWQVLGRLPKGRHWSIRQHPEDDVAIYAERSAGERLLPSQLARLTITCRRQSLAIGREPDDIDGGCVLDQRSEVLYTRWVWCNVLAGEGRVLRRRRSRDIGVDHPEL